MTAPKLTDIPVLWHGTSAKHISEIMRDGLVPNASIFNHVCLTSDRDTAQWFGDEMAHWEGHDMVLLQIDPAHLDIASFCHEEGWLESSLKEDAAAEYEGRPWMDMLTDFKVTGYRAVVPPKAMVVVSKDIDIEMSL